jgi:uncharacterized membrane protein
MALRKVPIVALADALASVTSESPEVLPWHNAVIEKVASKKTDKIQIRNDLAARLHPCLFIKILIRKILYLLRTLNISNIKDYTALSGKLKISAKYADRFLITQEFPRGP